MSCLGPTRPLHLRPTEVALHREFAPSSLIPEPGTYLDPNSGTVVNA